MIVEINVTLNDDEDTGALKNINTLVLYNYYTCQGFK